MSARPRTIKIVEDSDQCLKGCTVRTYDNLDTNELEVIIFPPEGYTLQKTANTYFIIFAGLLACTIALVLALWQ